MTSLNERTEQVLKLDAERTQGEWVFVPISIDGWNSSVRVVGTTDDDGVIANDEDYYPKAVEVRDLKFIASAPEMVAIIREQRELLHRLAWIVNRGLYAHKVGASTRPSLLSLQEELGQAGFTSEQGGE